MYFSPMMCLIFALGFWCGGAFYMWAFEYCSRISSRFSEYPMNAKNMVYLAFLIITWPRFIYRTWRRQHQPKVIQS